MADLLPAELADCPRLLEVHRQNGTQPDPQWLADGLIKAVDALSMHLWRIGAAKLAHALIDEWHAPVNAKRGGGSCSMSLALNNAIEMVIGTPATDALASVEPLIVKLIDRGAQIVGPRSLTIPSMVALAAGRPSLNDTALASILKLVERGIVKSDYRILLMAKNLVQGKRDAAFIGGLISTWTKDGQGLQRLSAVAMEDDSPHALMVLSIIRELELAGVAKANAFGERPRL